MPAAQGSCRKTIVPGILSALAFAGAAAVAGDATPLPDCLDGQPAETATVLRIVDGDTLVLTSRERVRLIGFNAPERVHDARRSSPEPLADDATRLLQTLLPEGASVTLVPGDDPEDRHGRRLAHVIGPDGHSVAEPLLRRGLAAQSAVAPNTRCAPYFRALETQARQARVGVWQALDAWQRDAPRLRPADRGFRIVSAVVTAVEDREDRIWLQLDGPLRISMTRAQATAVDAQSLTGEPIEVRGWLQRDGSRLKLALQHPANLRRLAGSGPLAGDR